MNDPLLQFLTLIFAGWVNRGQRDVIEDVQEEDRDIRAHESRVSRFPSVN